MINEYMIGFVILITFSGFVWLYMLSENYFYNYIINRKVNI